MSTERFKLIPAVHLFLIKDDQVLLLRRFNTGWEDGNYSVPAGHADGNETMRQAMAREALEEIGVTIRPEDLEIAHVMHRMSDSERVDFFFTAATWDGQPSNVEPEKCDDLSWYSLNALPENTIDYIRQALECYQKGESYSELGW